MPVNGVIAFDVATVTGWAAVRDWRTAAPVSSIVDFSRSKSRVERCVACGQWAREKILEHGPDLVILERPHSRNYDTTRLLIGMALAIEMVAWQLRVPLVEARTSVLKIHATGKGNAPKELVVAAARRRWPHVRDDNEADALWLVDLAGHWLALGKIKGLG